MIPTTSADEHENRTQRLAQWHQLARAYVLGGFLLAPAFQNAVMDHLVSASQGQVNENNEVGGISPPTLEFLYEKTAPDSPLRQLVLDVAIMHMNVGKIKHTDVGEPVNGDFFKALAMYALQYIQSHIGQNGFRPIVPWDGNPLRYYVSSK